MTSTNIDPPAASASERLDARTLANAKREALGRRTRCIRRSVLGIAAVVFVTAFLIIYVQLASGHDPALSKPGTATSKAATTAADRRKQQSASHSSKAKHSTTSSTSGSEGSASSAQSTSTGTKSSSTGTESSSSGTESSGSGAAVTTSQS
jgi:hypothetical protein